MNVLRNTTALALTLCLQYADETGAAVDATCGNGNDTLWLSEHFARVYGFDIQQEAISATAAKLKAAGRTNVELICDSHEHMERYVRETPTVIIFNLGYLPGGNRQISTSSGTTLQALSAALDLLAVDGLLCVTMYQGHREGYLERLKVLEWAGRLDKSVYHCVHTDMINQPGKPPEVLWITKTKDV